MPDQLARTNSTTYRSRGLLFLPLGLTVAIVGCDDEAPTAPTPTAGTVTAVTITSPSDFLHVGSSYTLTASATLSNGSQESATGGTWGGDASSVAAVSAGGEVRMVGSGEVTVFVDYKGMRGTKRVRGLPNYGGTWSGTYMTVACDQSGDFADEDFCEVWPAGELLPIGAALTQNQDRVTGRLTFGEVGGDVTGPIAIDGRLQLTGRIAASIFTIEFIPANLISRLPGQIEGEFAHLWTAVGATGSSRVSHRIVQLNRTSTTVRPQQGRRDLNSRSPRDIKRAMKLQCEGRTGTSPDCP